MAHAHPRNPLHQPSCHTHTCCGFRPLFACRFFGRDLGCRLVNGAAYGDDVVALDEQEALLGVSSGLHLGRGQGGGVRGSPAASTSAEGRG